MAREPDTYVHGHTEAVLRSHATRTVENSAAFVAGHLRPGHRVLDVGCGPGSITLELAELVAPGPVVGVDTADGALADAESRRAAAGVENCRFEKGDVYALDFDDDRFDVVYAHQVLQHLTDPVAALVEMRRVVAPGGVVAVRDADYPGMIWSPPTPAIDRWLELYLAIAGAARCDAAAGRQLTAWGRRAGFSSITASSSTWTYASPDSRAWWAGVWRDRTLASSYRDQVLAQGLATLEELETISAGWTAWGEELDGWFCIVHGEVLLRA